MALHFKSGKVKPSKIGRFQKIFASQPILLSKMGLTVDDQGTTYNAILAIYTGPNTDFTNLVPLACSAGHGPGHEVVSLDVLKDTNYWVVLSGILSNSVCSANADPAPFNYTLAAAPFFTNLPVSQTLTTGTNVTLTFKATGTPTLGYQWRLNGTNIPGATNTSLTISGFQVTNQGAYSILVTNAGGVNLFDSAAVYLNSQLRLIDSVMVGNSFYSQVLGVANTTYIIQASTNLVDWVTLETTNYASGVITFGEPMTAGNTNRFYRAKRY